MILVVDDNRELCEVLGDFLSLQGYPVRCAENGNAALRLLDSSEVPTLILLDVVMPVLDGWGTIDRLRGDPRFADIPVVIMSGARDIAERAKESGAVAIMYKPIEPQTLIGIIDRFSPRQ